MSRSRTILVLTLAALTSACALDVGEPSADAPSDGQVQALSGAARRPRTERIRDVAAASGLDNGVLLAGIAQVESGLSHCWSEATWACQGPYSAYCDGPVIAGAADGPCSAQQGGLGMFQFDGGNHAQTLVRDGEAILELDGNIARAVEFVIGIVRREIPEATSREAALAWMNDIVVAAGDARFERWCTLLACRYNGACGSITQANKYRTATLALLSEFEQGFWTASKPLPSPGRTDCQ